MMSSKSKPINKFIGKTIKFLDLSQESLKKKKLLKTFNRVLLSGNFILGKEVESFERKFAIYLGVKYCVGVANGQEAIQIALMALGLGSDDEVITTPISAMATSLAVTATGAKPVFVDTSSDGLINPDLIASAITKKTKVILPVHLFGNASDLAKIQTICKKYNLFLIEDAAQAHGSKYRGRFLGTFGNLGCFSFYPTKNLHALGDGGAIVTNNKNLAKVCRELRDYGQKDKYLHVRFGLNSRLDELQAAFLKVGLTHLDKDNQKRQKLALRYIQNLESLKEVEIIKPSKECQPNFHLFVIRAKFRDKLREYLKRSGIDTLVHYPTIIPDQPLFGGTYKRVNFSHARAFVRNCLSLPIHKLMNLSDFNYVSSKIISFYKNTL